MKPSHPLQSEHPVEGGNLPPRRPYRPNPFLHHLGAIAFVFAFILSILLMTVKALPDLEASLYGFVKFGYHGLSTFHCPVLMTNQDIEPVSMRLHNPLNRNLSWYIRAQFSSHSLIINNEQRIDLQAGETRTLTWDVSQQNVDLKNFILVWAYTSPAAAMSMTENTCGTLVLPLPFKGGPVLYYAVLGLTAISGLIGLLLWSLTSDMSNPSTASTTWWMRFVTLIAAVGIIASLYDLYFLAIAIILLLILSLTVHDPSQIIGMHNYQN